MNTPPAPNAAAAERIAVLERRLAEATREAVMWEAAWLTLARQQPPPAEEASDAGA